MTRTQRQLERCELARRLFIERVRERLVVQCPIVEIDSTRTGMPCRVPGIQGFADRHKLGWGQVADCGDSQLLYFFLPLSPSQRSELSGIDGLEIKEASQLNCDELITPWAPKASGHFSYAHTGLHYSDLFGHSNDPLSGHADWTGDTDPSYLKSDGSKIITNDGDHVSYRKIRYRCTGCSMAAVAADYSVELDCTPFRSIDEDYTMWGVTVRAKDDLNHYFANLSHSADRANNLQLYRRTTAAGEIKLAETTAGDTGIVRLEIVGSTIKVYVDGVEKISTSDGTLTDAEYPGVRVSAARHNQSGEGSADDFRVYIERAQGKRALLLGPLGGRAQCGYALAR